MDTIPMITDLVKKKNVQPGDEIDTTANDNVDEDDPPATQTQKTQTLAIFSQMVRYCY